MLPLQLYKLLILLALLVYLLFKQMVIGIFGMEQHGQQVEYIKAQR
jgi:hypothetical protein